jgi:hypothetical protein
MRGEGIMQYEITQIISYLVTAETPEEAMKKWDEHPKTSIIEWEDDNIELIGKEVEING